MNRHLLHALVAVASLGVAGCGGEQATGPAGRRSAAFLVLSPESASVLVAATVRLTAVAKDSLGNTLSEQPVTWLITNPAIAAVDSTGMVTGRGLGATRIIARLADLADSAIVTVYAQLEKVSGDLQFGTVGKPLAEPLVVKVVGAGQGAVPGAALTFTVVEGAGSLSVTTATTGDDGRASSVLTPGTIVGRNVVAVAGPWLEQSPTTFTAAGTADVPASLTKLSGDGQTAGTGRAVLDPPTVTVSDQYDNAVTGAVVSWVVTAGRGSVSAATNLTDAGRASVAWTLGTNPGPNTLEASVGALSPVVFAASGVFAGTGRIAFQTDRDGVYNIYVMNTDGTGATSLTGRVGGDFGPAWSPDGSSLAFETYRFEAGNSEIAVVNADGSGLARLTNSPGSDWAPKWSPVGGRIAFCSWRDGNPEIYVMNTDGSGVTRLTNSPGVDCGLTWAPDGSRIAFVSVRDGSRGIFVMNADGTNVLRLTGPEVQNPAWSPDGSRIAFAWAQNNNFDIWVMNPDGTGPRQLTTHPASDLAPAWSPDGVRLAFMSQRDYQEGGNEIYSMNPDGSGVLRLTRTASWEHAPAWGR